MQVKPYISEISMILYSKEGQLDTGYQYTKWSDEVLINNILCVENCKQFYGEVLGLAEGRRSEQKWQDYSLNGHQIVCHYVGESYRCQDYFNPVDGDEVPGKLSNILHHLYKIFC